MTNLRRSTCRAVKAETDSVVLRFHRKVVLSLDIPEFPLNTLQDRSLGYSQCAEASSIRSLFLRNTSVYNADARSQHYTALCTGVAYASCGKINYEQPLSSASKLWLTETGGVGKCQHDNATEVYSVAAVISDLRVYAACYFLLR